MARSFASASTARVDLSLGAGGSLTGACSLAAIVRRASDGATHNVINIGSTVNVVRTLRLDATNVVAFKSGASSGLGTTTVVAADGWTFIAGTKAAGTATPRVHIYKLSTRTWVHENTGASIGDITPSGASAIGVGASNAGPFNGDIAACGSWATALTDAQVETLAFSLVPWFSYTPKGLWVLDQAATGTKVWDVTGGGANESSLTATSVATSAVPIWNRGAPIPAVQFTPAAAAISLALSPATVTVTAVASSTTVGAVTAALGPATITTTTVALARTLGAATAALSPATVTATPVALGRTLGAVSVALSPATVTTTPVALSPSAGAVTLALTPASVTATAVALGVLPGGVTLALTPAQVQVVALTLGFASVARNIDYRVGRPLVGWRSEEPVTGWEADRPTLRSN